MALTIVRVSGGEGSWGQVRFKIHTVTWDSSYPTGGLTVSNATVGLGFIFGILLLGVKDATSAGIVPRWKPGTTGGQGTLIAIRGGVTAHTHVLNFKNAAVADGATTRVNVGTNLLGANTGGDLAVAGGGANGGIANSVATNDPLVEVANTTNLSTVVHTILFLGN